MDGGMRPSVGEQRTLARRWKRLGSIRGRIGGFAVSRSEGGKGEGLQGGEIREWVWQGRAVQLEWGRLRQVKD